MRKILFIIIATLSLCVILSCSKDEIHGYKASSALWFEGTVYERDGYDGAYVRKDSVEVSATQYPGKDEHIHNFKLFLIGKILSEPTEYKVVLIDSLSDESALKYVSIPEHPMFAAGETTDYFPVTIAIGQIPDGYVGNVAYRLEANQNFDEGYAQNQTIKLTINNVTTKPTWWKREITDAYLGEFSKEKYKAFIECTGRIDLEGLSPIEKRKICREFKQYVLDNNLKEADGTDMIIPIN